MPLRKTRHYLYSPGTSLSKEASRSFIILECLWGGRYPLSLSYMLTLSSFQGVFAVQSFLSRAHQCLCSEKPDCVEMTGNGGEIVSQHQQNLTCTDKRLFGISIYAVWESVTHVAVEMLMCLIGVALAPVRVCVWGCVIPSVCTFASVVPKRRCKTHLVPKISTRISWPYMRRNFSIFFLCLNVSSLTWPILETVALER